jgi:AcrR family transcriptional regulator
MVRPQKISDEEISAATIEVLRMFGASASVQQVANRLNISQPALFKRFGTKANLVTQSLLWWIAQLDWTAPFSTPPQRDEFIRQLEDIGKMAMEVAEKSMVAADAFRFLVSMKTPPPMVPLNLPTIPQLIDTTASWLQRADSDLIRTEDARPFALAFLGAVNMLSFTRHFMRTHEEPDIRSIITFLLSHSR